MATSVPVPIARPRSAWASAAASLTPSPTMATTLPSACSRLTTSTLSAGSTSAITVGVDADLGGDRAGRRLVVAGQQHRGRGPSSRNRAIASAEVGLTVVGDHEHARGPCRPSRPRPPYRRAPGRRPARAPGRGQVLRPLREQPRPADEYGVAGPVDDRPGRRGPRRWRSPRPAGSGPAARAASATARAIGCSEACSRAPASRSTSSASSPSAATTSTRVIRPVVTVPVLSSTIGVDPAGGLQDLGALDQDAELGAAAGADHQRGRRGQAQGARAGDDQHGDGGGERRRQPVTGADPEAQRADGQGDHDRDEDPGDPVGQPLHLGLAVLGVLDQLGHLGELGVGADPGGADDEPAAGVDGRADDGVAEPDLDRHRLAGQHRRVHRGRALLDDAVGGDLLARADDEPVADGELLGGDPRLDARRRPQHGDVLRAELQQRPQGGAGPALGAGLEVAAGQDERGHAGGGLEVDVAGAVGALDGELERVGHAGRARGAQEQRVQRPAERRQRAERDQRVHRRGAVPQVGPGGLVERPGAPHHDRRGQGERQPLPVGELQRRDHRHRDHRHGQHGGDQQPVRAATAVGSSRVAPGRRRRRCGRLAS